MDVKIIDKVLAIFMNKSDYQFDNLDEMDQFFERKSAKSHTKGNRQSEYNYLDRFILNLLNYKGILA